MFLIVVEIARFAAQHGVHLAIGRGRPLAR
jgi:hypothetical protein